MTHHFNAGIPAFPEPPSSEVSDSCPGSGRDITDVQPSKETAHKATWQGAEGQQRGQGRLWQPTSPNPSACGETWGKC